MDEKKPPLSGKGPRIPEPAHPHIRHEPLPWHKPKPAHEDPDAPMRIEAILSGPGYRQADQDIDFLNRDDTRGLRLQLDYLKPETLLGQHGIVHTIVVFGSTRVPEPATARSRVDALRRALAENPGDSRKRRQLAIAERLLDKSRYYDVAREFGRLVGDAGKGSADSRIVIMTGGGPGMMEAANRGADDVGAKSVGLNIKLPHEQFPNPYVTPDLCFSFHYFALRKLHFLLRARALVAFPGGYGTFDELFETLTLIQTRKIMPLPVILVGEKYWRQAFDVDFLVDEGVIDAEDRDLFWFAESAEDIWAGIAHWYQASGEPLIPA
ncbi:putative lysine decarboxylase [mine drainage metagenome]|uniref:Putative lysine decarboxylase n=1 Tax=mine drainage metagenome TaxID=410659 RepID=A0A1J5RDN6_9ZZZZ